MGKPTSRKTKIIVIACVAAFVAASAAVLLGVLLTQLPKEGFNVETPNRKFSLDPSILALTYIIIYFSVPA